MIDIKRALSDATTTLNESSSPQLDAEILLSFVLEKNRTYLYAHLEDALDDHQLITYQQLIAQRVIGTPIAYLTGTREFWSLPLRVNHQTLIPRPETELLVEGLLSILSNHGHATILDLGTGSGAIALAVAKERPEWQLFACDKSQAAIDIAQENAQQLALKNIQFLCSDWFSSIKKQRVDAIVSNPPYIAEDDPHLRQGDVRFEPRQALVSGKDGLDALRYVIQTSYDWLVPGGILLLEHGFEQSQAVTDLLRQSGYQDVQSWKDHQGFDRISGGWSKK